MGVFSTLNHLDDISISWRSTYLCGLTREEIESTFGPELNALGEASGLTYSETMADLEGIIKDIIYSVMGNYTVDEARSNSEKIKEEVITKIQERFDSDFIYSVSFNFLYS